MPGIIIGVGALVAMPAMINGMAPYASETIAAKSSLESLTISTKSSIRINGIFVERDTLAQLDEALLIRIIFGAYPARKAALPDPVAAIRR